MELNQVTKTRHKQMLLVTLSGFFLTRDAAIPTGTIICCSLLAVLEKKLAVKLNVCKTFLGLSGNLEYKKDESDFKSDS